MALIKSHIPWAIKIDNFPEQAINLTYNKTAQSPTWNFFDTDKMYISGGTTSEINAGTYYTEFLPFRKFVFPNGTKKIYYAPWVINKAQNKVTLSETSGEVKIKFIRSFTVSRLGDGEVTVTSSNPNVAEVSLSGNKVTITGKKVGDVTITINVAEGTNYLAASATYFCKSRKTQITVPTVTNISQSYHGYALHPTVTNAPSTNLVERTGTFSAIYYSPSLYSFTYRILDTDAYEWADGTTAPKTFYWYINKAVFPIPAQVGTAEYDGGYYVTPTWNFSNYSNSHLVQITNGSATNVGNYTATFHLADTVNCQWSDDSTGDKTATWRIDKAEIPVPTLQNSQFDATGSYQSVEFYDYDDRWMRIVSGTTTAKDIGSYQVNIELWDTNNTKWADGSPGKTKILRWKIEAKYNTAQLNAGEGWNKTVYYYAQGDMERKYTLFSLYLPDDYSGTVTYDWSIDTHGEARCFAYEYDKFGNPREIWISPAESYHSRYVNEEVDNSIGLIITVKSDGIYNEKIFKTGSRNFRFDYHNQ